MNAFTTDGDLIAIKADYSQPTVIRSTDLDGYEGAVDLTDSDSHEAWTGPLSALHVGLARYVADESGRGSGAGSSVHLSLLAVGTPDYDGSGCDADGLRWSLHYFPKRSLTGRQKPRNLALAGFRSSLAAIKRELPEFIKAILTGVVIGVGLLADGGAL